MPPGTRDTHTMTRPILHTFSISHFSEKARWGLDWAGIDYELRPNIPFAHMWNARRLKVPHSSVPILEQPGKAAIQGSSDILDWAAAHTANFPKGGEDIEARLDAKLGRYVIYYFYGEAALDTPQAIPPLFKPGLTPGKRRTFTLGWPLIRRAMILGMGLNANNHAKARTRLMAELDWLDGELADGRPYLFGDTPGRGDLTAASLIAPLVQPPEHPVYGANLTVPPRMARDCKTWRNRPIMELVARMYRDHR